MKIEITSEPKNVLNHEIVYRADKVEKVEVRLPKKKLSMLLKIVRRIGCDCIGLLLFYSLLPDPLL